MPMSSNIPNADLIARYITGEASASERLRVTRLLQDQPEYAELVAQLTRLSETRGMVEAKVDVDDALARFFERVQGFRRESQTSIARGVGERPGLGRARVWGNRTVRAVGIALGAAAMVWGILLWQPRNRSDHGASMMHAYVTRGGEQASLVLSDGTRVMLAPNTTLQLLRFGEHARAVALNGEAYFQVSHAASAPFLVQTRGATVRVLGTAFLVRTSGDGHLHVAVSDGKVAVRPNRSRQMERVVSAGFAGDVRDSTVWLSVPRDVADGVELQQGNFVFRRTPLSKVLETLTRWYGYQFRCADSAIARQVVTVWLSQRSSATAVTTLEDLLDARAVMSGDTITLVSPKRGRGLKPSRVQSYDIWVPNQEVGR